MNIFNQIEKVAQKHGEKVAIETDLETLSYVQLLNLLISNQKKLFANGYKAGDRVAIYVKNQKDFVIQFLSLLSIGCWITPVFPDTEEIEFQRILEDTCSKELEYELVETSYRGEELIEGKLQHCDSKNCGIFHMTSGTTGRSKYCIRTLESLAAEGESYRKTFEIIEKDKIFSAPPIYHSYALGAGLMAALMSHCSVLILERFTPRTVLKEIQKLKVTMLLLVPIMAKFLTEVKTQEDYDTSSLRIVLVGAGAISKKLISDFKEKYQIALSSNYGSTETGGIVSRIGDDSFESIGKTMPDILIKIVDESSKEVKNGEKGQIMVKSPGMQIGYLDQQISQFDSDGYWPTGDLGKIDDKGNIFLVGRLKNIINVGGKKVVPQEVEEVILKMPKVKEAAVIGAKKENGEEVIKAFVVMKNEYAPYRKEEVREFCSLNSSQYKIPSVVEFIPKLPRNKLGKVLYHDLQELR